MKKWIFLAVCVAVLGCLALLSVTKPDREAHYAMVKQCMLEVVTEELEGNPVTAEYVSVGTMTALNLMDEYLPRYMVVNEHTFYNAGIIVYKERRLPVSIGVFGHIWLTAGKEKMKEMMHRPDVQQMLGVDKIKKSLSVLEELKKKQEQQ